MNRFLASVAIAASLSFASAANAAEVYDQQLAAPAEDQNQALEATPPAPAPVDSLQNLYRVASSLPEPANWLMMIIGFGSAGAILRRRRTLREFD